jgi:hypothetical protein
MDIATIILAIVVAGMFGFLILRLNKLQTGSGDDGAKERIGELAERLRKAESERDELAGKGKVLHAAMTKLEAENKMLNKEVAEYEATEKKREEQLRVHLQQLESTKQALADERVRVQRADEERLRETEEERDRVWNDHEMSVIALLKDLCKKPEYHFACYDNTDLPAGFDGSLKPDFLIEFLGQYVIFDAKASKAKSLQTYITDTVKKTVEKVKENEKIAKFLYLVVPTQAIGELKGKYRHAVGDCTVYVVSPESLAPILAALKRITTYEVAEKLDPMQRENIINLIAHFDWHISMRNGFDILMAKQGADIVGTMHRLVPDLIEEILDRKEKLGISLPSKTEVKRLLDPMNRLQDIAEMEQPRPKVVKKAIEAAKALFD